MFKQKTYSGTFSEYVSSNTGFTTIPGLTNVATGNVSLSKLVGTVVVEFLNMCGVKNVRYDEENHYTYILGLPFLFLVQNTYYGNAKARRVIIYSPFNTNMFLDGQVHNITSAYSGRPALFTFIFDTSNNYYEITMRACGSSNSFYLMFGTYVKGNKTISGTGSPSSYTFTTDPYIGSGSGLILFAEATDLIRNLKAVAYVNYNTSNNTALVTDIDKDGNVLSNGYYSTSGYSLGTYESRLQLRNDSFDLFDGKFPLVNICFLYFELNNSYCYLENYKLPNSINLYDTQQQFITINDNSYLITMSIIGIIKIDT